MNVGNQPKNATKLPFLSLIIPMFNVERYLGELFASLDAQVVDVSLLEFIFVDDGSSDGSAQRAEAWLARSRVTGHVIRQANQGPGIARNRGIDEATGAWMTFPDSDDVLGVDYLRIVLEILKRTPGHVTALATNIIYLDERTGTLQDDHPLRPVFAQGRRIVDLDKDPQAIKLQAASTFFRRDIIDSQNIRFDARIRPNFEDAAFVMRYLAAVDSPALAIVPEAHYLYRRRADATSLVASSWTNPAKYIEVPRFGWLDTLSAIADAGGRVPLWAQVTVLYDLHWYFRFDGRIHTPTRSIPPAVLREFMDMTAQVLGYIEPATIMGYSLTDIPLHTRVAWMAMRGSLGVPAVIEQWRVDEIQGLTQLKYHFAGDRPDESFAIDGVPVEPAYAKDRAVVYFGETVMYERILWLPNRRGLTACFGSSEVPIREHFPFEPGWSASGSEGSSPLAAPSRSARRLAADLRRLLRARGTLARARVGRLVRGRSKIVRAAAARVTLAEAKRGKWYDLFHDAWVFMDRDTQAQDNAEHLYRWVRAHRPDVNAWFVLRQDTADWDRLKSEGFRLIAFGSHQHTLLLKNAEHLISSHVDQYVVHPLNRKRYGKDNWTYTFLQHGVTKDDISRWLNGKPIELLVTTSRAERASFIDNGTPYVFTGKQVKLTGFPRHDALLEKARAIPHKDLVLIMPTWREYLMGPATGAGNDRTVIDGFEMSIFARTWAGFLADERLHEQARERGLRLAFVPHPNLEPHIEKLRLPDDVDVLTYGSMDVQMALARAAVLVTDYSSLAFDAAYTLTPVVYFQFDRDEFFQRHPHRRGYYDYESDGFGPVTTSTSDAVGAVASVLDPLSEATATYRTRADAFFLARDGRNCERTAKAIAALRTPWAPQDSLREATQSSDEGNAR